ncbi:MAG: hypothetical protein M0Q02_10410 [Candidatus Muirbacterium halophilum]|nr:hypothetical protein [Candidatus Muirbacterium halophilum]
MKDFKGIITTNIFLGKSFLSFPGRGNELRKRLRLIFRERILLYKTKFEPDFILINNNLFGTNMFASSDVKFVESFFAELDIPIIINPGNLDEYNEVSIYNKISFPKNVTVFKNEQDVFIDNQNRFVICQKSNYSKDNFFNIILSNEKIDFNSNYVFVKSNEKNFSFEKNIVDIPSFEFLSDFEQEEAGCVLFSYVGGKSSASFLNETEFKIFNVKVNLNDFSLKEELESFILKFADENNIVKFMFYGPLYDISILRFLDSLEENYEDKFFYLDIVDNTVVSQELIKMIPPHVEEGLYIKNVRKSYFDKQDKKDIEQKILKKGLLFFDLNL